MATGRGDSGTQGGRSRPSFRIHYRTALVLWLITASWIAVLMAFTWLFWRDGPPPQTGPFGWPLLGLFWLAGLSVGSWGSSFALVSMLIDDDGVRVREWFPHRVRTTRCGIADIGEPRVVESVDDDGDPRFRCELRLPDGRSIRIAESHRRHDVSGARDRIVAALARNG